MDELLKELEKLKDMMRTYGGIQYTQELAAMYVSKAKQAISGIENSIAADTLSKIADFALSRKS